MPATASVGDIDQATSIRMIDMMVKVQQALMYLLLGLIAECSADRWPAIRGIPFRDLTIGINRTQAAPRAGLGPVE